MSQQLEYTPELQKKIEELKQQAIEKLYSGEEYDNWNQDDTVNYVERVYEIAEHKKKPVVIIANTIQEYKKFFNLLFNPKINEKNLDLLEEIYDMKNNTGYNKKTLRSKVDSFMKVLRQKKNDKIVSDNYKTAEYHYNFLLSEYSRAYLLWYYFLNTEFKIPLKDQKSEEHLKFLHENVLKASVAKGFFYEQVALILRMPRTIKTEGENLHCTTFEGAIAYPDQKIHILNGRRVEDWVFEKYFNKTLTFEDFNKEENEDIRASIVTLIQANEGNQGLLNFLGAQKVDEQVIEHANGYSETMRLYKTAEKYSFLQDHKGNFNVPYAWLEMTCPSTGQMYLINTSAAFKNVKEAAKFHRPANVPQSVEYHWQSAN